MSSSYIERQFGTFIVSYDPEDANGFLECDKEGVSCYFEFDRDGFCDWGIPLPGDVLVEEPDNEEEYVAACKDNILGCALDKYNYYWLIATGDYLDKSPEYPDFVAACEYIGECLTPDIIVEHHRFINSKE